jgi:Acyl-CoA synthetases (AMP-forming)/AMP-acid ligases II
MLQQNFAYLLEKRALLHPSDIAVVDADTGSRYSYGELVRRSCRLAHALKDRGIGRGDRICCLTKNSVEYIDLFMAAARLGAMLCPVNYRLAIFEMRKIVADAEPSALIFDAEFAETAKALHEEFPALGTVWFFGEGAFPWARPMESETCARPDSGPPIDGDSDPPLLMLFTAGSTGRPKGVPLKQSNLFFSAFNWIVELGINRNDYTLTVLPLFHIGGHILWTLPHLLIGAKVLLLRRFEPERTLQLIEREKITNTYLIPAMAKMVVALPGWKKYDLRSIRFIGSGGEAVSDRITSAFGEIGIPILNSYGLTETSDGTASIRPYDAMGKAANCIGQPLPFVDLRIVDSGGREVGPGEEGQIIHRGPSVVESYWRRPEETARVFRDGWFYTGDIAKRDEEGYLYFLGRKDDMIVTGGENVYPAEVEEAILRHPKVADAAVLGVPDEKWGQTIKAVISVKGGESLGKEEIGRYLETRLSGFKRPRIVEFVPQLPKIGSGKLDRALIKKSYG